MNLIITALRRPITILVTVIGVALASGLALTRMPVDIFPNLNLPVIYVAQPYGGMDPSQMESYPRHLLRVPLPLRHGHRARRVEVDSERRPRQALLPSRHGYEPGARAGRLLRRALEGLHAAGHGQRRSWCDSTRAAFRSDNSSSRARRATWPRFRTSRSSACARSSRRCLASLRRRPSAATSARSIVRVDPDRLREYQMSPEEVVKAVAAGNTILPGRQRAHRRPEPPRADQLGRVEHSRAGRAADPNGQRADGLRARHRHVENGSDILTGYGLVQRQRTVYIPVTKRADASTLEVVNRVKSELPRIAGARARRHQGQF